MAESKKPIKWIALGYNLPVSPSKNRVYIWRKLKDIGANYFRPGVAVLPQNSPRVEELKKIAYRIREMGGDSYIVRMEFLEKKDEMELVERFHTALEQEYYEVDRYFESFLSKIDFKKLSDQQVSDLKKMIRSYKKTRSRDYFGLTLGIEIEKKMTGFIKQLQNSADGINERIERLWNK